MNVDTLKEALRTWMGTDTWHTNHQLDDQRFHNALEKAFSDLGTSIHFGEFEKAMGELVEEYHPDWDDEYKRTLVEDFATRSEHIASYLNDTT